MSLTFPTPVPEQRFRQTREGQVEVNPVTGAILTIYKETKNGTDVFTSAAVLVETFDASIISGQTGGGNRDTPYVALTSRRLIVPNRFSRIYVTIDSMFPQAGGTPEDAPLILDVLARSSSSGAEYVSILAAPVTLPLTGDDLVIELPLAQAIVEVPALMCVEVGTTCEWAGDEETENGPIAVNLTWHFEVESA